MNWPPFPWWLRTTGINEPPALRGLSFAPARPRPVRIRAFLESQACGLGISLPSPALPLASGRQACDVGLERARGRAWLSEAHHPAVIGGKALPVRREAVPG